MEINKYPYGNPFKFKSLKFFSSSEWMANNLKKYRKVFDKQEISYMHAMFSFYNKLFDEENWDAIVSVKTFKLNEKNEKEEIFSLEENIKINKEDNIIDVEKSWGVPNQGGFWKQGKYLCEGYINNILVGSDYFYIEDIGLVTANINPYFEVVSLKLFSGDSNILNAPVNERKYLSQFNQSSTQYVWVEYKIKNKTDFPYNLEFFINFYDNAGQHKATLETIRYIEKGTKDYVYTYERGWGNNDPGSWKDNKYSIEVVFMDTLISYGSFLMGEQDVEGELDTTSPLKTIQSASATQIEENNSETLEQVLESINELIGLESIKQKIKDHIKYIDFLNIRKEKGFIDTEKISLHSVFTGNPGTGKTTIVKLLGKVYQKMGLLSKGHVHEVDRADLVAEFIGQTAPKVKKNIEQARGGILFIDEAYMLSRENDDKKDFGKEVIEILIKELSDGVGDIAIMVAGYPHEMEIFINSNPGLKSRFNHYFRFDDYTPDELLLIAQYAAQKRSVKIDEEGKSIISKIITDAYRNRDNSFGNARFAISLIDEAKMNMGLRLMNTPEIKTLTSEQLSTISAMDVEKIIHKNDKSILNIPIEDQLLKESLKELNNLIGIDNIKNDINELIKLVIYYRNTGKDVLNKFSLHTIFIGNPGTGKTTVARIIGKIYKALGLLERGHIVETGREGLIAGYVGQTALKTKSVIEKAMGGVLFIDEAYALFDDNSSGFGKEAIEVILKNMEDHRGSFALIVAGYPFEMNKFLLSNPGLKSRFDKTIIFNDYDVETLFNISKYMLNSEGLIFDDNSSMYIHNYLNELYQKRDKYFGNARTVRKIIENIVKNQNIRMASLDKNYLTEDNIKTVILDDVKNLKIDENFVQNKPIGFSY